MASQWAICTYRTDGVDFFFFKQNFKQMNREILRIAFLVGMMGLVSVGWGQTNNYFGASGALSGSVWSTNPAGPYTSAFNTTGGGIANFQNAATPMGATIILAGINATPDVTLISTGGTISNQGNGIIPVDVGSGATLDFGNQAFTSSTNAGYTKNGSGVLATTGGSYQGGFTLNAGTMIVRGVTAMGSGASNTLTINGGILAANATRDLNTTRFGGGITIGGDFTIGATTGLALSSANLTISNNVSLGAGASRAITIGGTGLYLLEVLLVAQLQI